MTFRADFEVNFGLRRSRPERLPARAFDHGVDVIGMYVRFHRPPINDLLYTFPFDFTYRIDYSTAIHLIRCHVRTSCNLRSRPLWCLDMSRRLPGRGCNGSGNWLPYQVRS